MLSYFIDYGYCDNILVYQSVKVFKVLNEKIKLKWGIITKRDFIIALLNNGYRPKLNYDRISALEKNGVFYKISNIEYDFAVYILKKGYIE